jgi:diguanylate cyclase (GGDEF)-like protein
MRFLTPEKSLVSMKSYNELFERLQKNEEIAQRFHEIEIKILSIYNFKNLFEVLLTEIRNQFGVPYVWISLIDGNEVSTLVQSLTTSDTLSARMCIVDREIFEDLFENSQKPLLVNKDLTVYLQLLPPNRSYLIRSMAIAPISLYGKVIGSINQADFTKERFQPGLDTKLLQQLAMNRRVMESILEREFLRAQRYQSQLSAAFIDVDDFKQINDTFGHDAGDELLKYLASLLSEMSRQSDVATRFAGDEFVLICPETSANSTETMLKRLQSYINDNPLVLNANIIPFSISFGVASTKDKSIFSSKGLLKKADEALYRMKNAKHYQYFGVS